MAAVWKIAPAWRATSSKPFGPSCLGLVLATRLNVYDGIPYRKSPANEEGEPCPWQAPVQSAWGTREDNPLEPDLTEPIAWIGEMKTLGVELVNVSMGNPYASPHLVRPFEYPPPDGYETPEHPLIGVDRHFRLTEALQQQFPDLPLVGSGYSYLQEFLFQAGAANLRDGRTTFVGVGRAAAAAARLRTPASDRGPAGSKADLPHVQLLHGPDAGQAQRPGPIRDRLSAV